MIDSEGYRPNVGMIVVNDQVELLWAKRVGQTSYQFPQGGIKPDETPEQALYRELKEELGLSSSDVQLIGATSGWLKYKLPDQYLRQDADSGFVGQKQKWFLLHLVEAESRINFNQSETPEFDGYTWVSYWYPLAHIIDFKKQVYQQALAQLEPLAAEHFNCKLPLE